ncbi:hypothetical protein Q8A73_013297 [Channa argus]|nr:hypothetical protein Q8A73_013297 [Channa argus]
MSRIMGVTLLLIILVNVYYSPVMSKRVQVVQVQPESRVLSGQWSTGICECYKDMGDCCFALCCLPVFTCKVTSALGACPCLPLLDCVGCVSPASLAMRASVRERYVEWSGPCGCDAMISTTSNNAADCLQSEHIVSPAQLHRELSWGFE